MLPLRRMDAVLATATFTQGYSDGVDHLMLDLALQWDDSPPIADELTHRSTTCRVPAGQHAPWAST